jgi:hypothetical protein
MVRLSAHSTRRLNHRLVRQTVLGSLRGHRHSKALTVSLSADNKAETLPDATVLERSSTEIAQYVDVVHVMWLRSFLFPPIFALLVSAQKGPFRHRFFEVAIKTSQRRQDSGLSALHAAGTSMATVHSWWRQGRNVIARSGLL